MRPTNAKITNYYSALPRLETLNYCVIYCIMILWSIGSLLLVSKENENRYLSYDVLGTTGWYRWIGRHKDISDFEWEFWENCFFASVVVGFVGHFIIARMADSMCPQYRFEVYCVYSIIFSLYYLRFQGFLFLLIHFTIQYIVAKSSKSLVACWMSGCLLAYSLTTEGIGAFLRSCYPEDNSKAFFVLFTTAMCNLRYISFSIEYIWSLADGDHDKLQNAHLQKHSLFTKLFRSYRTNTQQSNDNSFSFRGLLVYQMYYPLCYGGPVINYNDFHMQLKKPPVFWDLKNSSNFAFGIAKYILWHLVLNLLLHFFYVSALGTDYALISRLPLFSVFGLGVGMAVFFCLKYVCMYGLTSHFSSSDNLDVPGPPHCLFTKHRVTDMWKFFDKGLHSWLVRYIYIPLGGSRVPTIRLVLNSILPFAFVYMWHGSGKGQAYWAGLSWLGVVIESVCYRLYKTEIMQSHEVTFLTPTWSRRIRALLSAPLLCLLMTSNLFFLWNFEVALLYCKRIFFESFKFLLLLYLFFYVGCQTSMELHRMGVGM